MARKEQIYCDQCGELFSETLSVSNSLVSFADYGMDFHADCLKELTVMQFIRKLQIPFRVDFIVNSNINISYILEYLDGKL